MLSPFWSGHGFVRLSKFPARREDQPGKDRIAGRLAFIVSVRRNPKPSAPMKTKKPLSCLIQPVLIRNHLDRIDCVAVHVVIVAGARRVGVHRGISDGLRRRHGVSPPDDWRLQHQMAERQQHRHGNPICTSAGALTYPTLAAISGQCVVWFCCATAGSRDQSAGFTTVSGDGNAVYASFLIKVTAATPVAYADRPAQQHRQRDTRRRRRHHAARQLTLLKANTAAASTTVALNQG